MRAKTANVLLKRGESTRRENSFENYHGERIRYSAKLRFLHHWLDCRIRIVTT
jgi:hypothetical protein